MLGDRIKELRKAKRLSQSDFAIILDVSQGAVTQWERGVRKPDVDMLQAIADYFGVTTDYLLGRDAINPLTHPKEYLESQPGVGELHTVAAHHDGEVTEEFMQQLARQIAKGNELLDKWQEAQKGKKG